MRCEPSDALVATQAARALTDRLGGACFAPYALVARLNQMAARLTPAEKLVAGPAPVCEVPHGLPD